MLDLYSYIKIKINLIKQKIPPINTIEQKLFSFLKVILIIFAICFMIGVISWICEKDDTIAVQPIDIGGAGENIGREPLTALLRLDLEKIKDIYGQQPVASKNHRGNRAIPRPLDELGVPGVACPQQDLKYSISAIGNVGFEGTSISLGNLIISMKEIFGNDPSTISCSLQRYNSTIILTGILDDHHSVIRAFEVDKTLDKVNISNDEKIPPLIYDLAYQISLELSKRRVDQSKEDDRFPQNWQTYRNITRGRDALNNFLTTNETKYLDELRNTALSARNSEPDCNGTLELYLSLGVIYLNNNNLDEAERIFINTTRFKPFESTLCLGVIYYTQGDYTEALNAFNKATQLRPKDALAWYNKGRTLFALDNYVEAVQAYDEAIKLDPKDAAYAWNNKGNALTKLPGKLNEAITAYDEAIRLDPYNANSYYTNKGNVLRDNERYEDAFLNYEKAIELNPRFSQAWYGKGNVLTKLPGKLNEAIKAYDEAILINPEYKEAWKAKGDNLLILGEYNKSIEAFNNARRIDSSYADASNDESVAYYYQGYHLWCIGKCEEAIRAYDKSLQLNPKNSRSGKARSTLNNCSQ